MYDKSLRTRNGVSPPSTGYGSTRDANEAPGWNTRGSHSPISESEDDDEWEVPPFEYDDESKVPLSESEDDGEREITSSDDSEDETDDEWLIKMKAKYQTLLRLRKEIETMEANIEERDQEEAAIRESEQRLKDRTPHRTSVTDQATEDQEKKEESRRVERIQARSATTVKLGRARQELKKSEDNYKESRCIQSRQRREQADRAEAALKATAEHAAQQEAEQKTAREEYVSPRLARENEERRREAEVRRRETERREERESKKDESIRRQRLFEKIDKKRHDTVPPESRSPYFSDLKQNDTGPTSSHLPHAKSRRDQLPFRTGSPRRAYNSSTSRRRDLEKPDSGSDSDSDPGS